MAKVALRHTDSGAKIVDHAPTLTVAKLIEHLSEIPGDTPVIAVTSGEWSTVAANVTGIDVEYDGNDPDEVFLVTLECTDNYDPRQW
jgi:hypothetical protein